MQQSSTSQYKRCPDPDLTQDPTLRIARESPKFLSTMQIATAKKTMEAYPTVKEKKGSMKDMLKKKESTHENAIHQIHEDNPKHKEKHPDH